ncbi:MAG: hypothetical protein N3D71_03195 [Burkholderiaceae bacterium]|nr:hypothetical protein [Burkholderiaceae bacterium]
MDRRRFLAQGALALIAAPWVAQAQKATEQFIPIGQSPGVSGKATIIGTIEAVDAAARTMTISAGATSYRCALTDRTRIWIDRSAQRLSATTGRLADLQKGRRVEVKFTDATRKTAEWVKVEAAG